MDIICIFVKNKCMLNTKETQELSILSNLLNTLRQTIPEEYKNDSIIDNIYYGIFDRIDNIINKEEDETECYWCEAYA